MTNSHADFILRLYEACLLSPNCPYTELGNQLGRQLGFFSLSIWAQHLLVREASAPIVFFQKGGAEKNPVEGRDLAAQVFKKPEIKQGTRNNLYYWVGPLAGAQIQSALIVWSDQPFSPSDLASLEALAPRLTVLLDLIQLNDLSDSHRVARELQAAKFIQERLTPPLDALGGKEFLSYRMLPLHELGGDYLDIIPFADGSVGLTVADAMGKGVPGAFIMLMARTIFRFIAGGKIPPDRILSVLNNQFAREVQDMGVFVTQFYGIYDPQKSELLYANAGHNPPLLYQRRLGQTRVLKGGGVALGGKMGAVYKSYKVKLESGDILAVFSDGLWDARNGEGVRFGRQGLENAVLSYKEYTADAICDGLMRKIMQHSHSQEDDLSFLILKAD